jgi:hypothetical protein
MPWNRTTSRSVVVVTLLDVIDRQGAVAARVDVPNGGRVVGFGVRSIYVVRKDADDLQYLQGFPL